LLQECLNAKRTALSVRLSVSVTLMSDIDLNVMLTRWFSGVTLCELITTDVITIH